MKRTLLVKRISPLKYALHALFLILLSTSSGFAAEKRFKDCDTCPEMVVIAPGSFEMGEPTRDRKPVHTVHIAYSFAVGKYEVTQAEWRAVMGDNPSQFQGDNRPVERVTWNEVQVFLDKLSQKTGQNYRLLTETEWEYVARAGTTTKWTCGQKKSCVKEYGWYRGISDRKTQPVGQKKPNPFGLYDMAGNVGEWTADCYQDSYEGLPGDGTFVPPTKECHKRVVRGGSWKYLPRDLKPATRSKTFVTFELGEVGFRVAKTL
ncbi:MAG: hypothetical protein COB46_11095 [Rhodospirillaceae bacterium]|nr:MAG: hypothetical protein COB46_11095 [Rhodospirillaceae bacterium]